MSRAVLWAATSVLMVFWLAAALRVILNWPHDRVRGMMLALAFQVACLTVASYLDPPRHHNGTTAPAERALQDSSPSPLVQDRTTE